jgi:hypothetical protein
MTRPATSELPLSEDDWAATVTTLLPAKIGRIEWAGGVGAPRPMADPPGGIDMPKGIPGSRPMCSKSGCDKPNEARGWCIKHYTRWRRHGDSDKRLRERIEGTAEERFWPKVDKTDTCWLWTARKTRQGYGEFAVGIAPDGTKLRMYAHRWAYEQHVGPMPEGLELDHLCKQRACVRPDHLEAVTHAENVRRGDAPAVAGAHERAKTHCPKGHPYSGDNLIIARNGGRLCRTCRRASSLRWYYQQRKKRANGDPGAD